MPGSPYHHLDWRALVRSALSHRGWTQRELAQRVGMSEGNLSVLLKGRGRRLGAEWTPAFCAALHLGEHAARWFAALVDRESESERARDAAELYLRTRLAQLRSSTPEQDVVDAQGDWRVNVIQELATCEGFRPDPAWIARALEPEITEAEAAKAWQTLLRTGLVRPRDDGGFDVVSVRTESVLAPSQALAGLRMQTSVFDLVQRGWRLFRGNERHGGVITMALSEAGATRVLQRLRELEQELVQLAVEDPDPRNRVYVLTTQWVPTSNYTDSDEAFTASEAPRRTGD